MSIPNIAEVIEYGEITIGMQRPLGCIATAAYEECTRALLVRHRGESLLQLRARLDQAADKALTLSIFVDEING